MLIKPVNFSIEIFLEGAVQLQNMGIKKPPVNRQEAFI